MSHLSEGLLAALRDASYCGAEVERVARVVSGCLADHLDALAEGSSPDEFDRNAIRGWLAAAAEIRAAGGVE